MIRVGAHWNRVAQYNVPGVLIKGAIWRQTGQHPVKMRAESNTIGTSESASKPPAVRRGLEERPVQPEGPARTQPCGHLDAGFQPPGMRPSSLISAV